MVRSSFVEHYKTPNPVSLSKQNASELNIVWVLTSEAFDLCGKGMILSPGHANKCSIIIRDFEVFVKTPGGKLEL